MEKMNTGITLFVLAYEFSASISAAIFCDNQFKSVRYPGQEFNRSGDSNLE
jgi:hypothetical protein